MRCAKNQTDKENQKEELNSPCHMPCFRPVRSPRDEDVQIHLINY